ncbi:hypothetical protein ABEB36_002564 [Hypothenemus hampei]|uniref:ZSWIM1/3 RNaseH-like domain-containing protein n=1 Tax=Hypothenemus hampei TaxID=57062 RepID=A0ABD1F673_HYPHA
MNVLCTSEIKLIKENGKILVEYQKCHYGHALEIQHIRLPKSEKQNIASKLVSEITPQRILQSTRDNIEKDSKRIDLLKMKDLENIKTSYGIEWNDGKRDFNDAFSVALWVKECESLKENPVLLFKPQGQEHNILKTEDFCLIIMNSFQKQMIKKFPCTITIDNTHGLNGYDFEMTTIMVLDEFHHGFPVAHMFSNKKDTAVQTIFFTLVKGAVGRISIYLFSF